MEDSPNKDLERVIELIEAGQQQALQNYLEVIHPADIADVLDELPPEYAVVVFELLPDDVASEVLDETGTLVRQELVEKVDDERLADLLDVLPMDDAVDFLETVPEETASRLIDLMEPDEASEVRELLSYEEDSAGRLMNQDVASLRRHWTVGEAMAYLRRLVDSDDAEMVYYLYVVDRDGRLIGVVPIRTLLMAHSSTTIESIMRPEVFTIPVMADQEELAEVVSKYDFVAIPVVDDQQHLLGVVTVDDVLDVVTEEATEDIQRLGGSEPLDQPYFSASVMQVVGKRLIWLLPLFGASLVTDAVIDNFAGLLTLFVSLNIFIPVISGTGGNAGSQTVATIIRAIAINEVRPADFIRAWTREFSVAIILGLVLGAAGYLRGLIFDADPGVPLVLALTLPLVVMWANTVATLVPLTAQKLKIDPTVVSAPMITTIVDASGLLLYLSLASLILR